MAFGYTPQGSGGMSYCNQTPFPPREGWGLGTRLAFGILLAGRHGNAYCVMPSAEPIKTAFIFFHVDFHLGIHPVQFLFIMTDLVSIVQLWNMIFCAHEHILPTS